MSALEVAGGRRRSGPPSPPATAIGPGSSVSPLNLGGTVFPRAVTIGGSEYRAGQTRANNAVVRLSESGALSVSCGQPAGTVHVDYTVDAEIGGIRVRVDARGLNRAGATELVVMNELGANHFPLYADCEGVRLRGTEIGTWEEVNAPEASFISLRLGISFTMRRLPESRLFRGRELTPGRLSWAGFAYSLPPTAEGIEYILSVGASP